MRNRLLICWCDQHHVVSLGAGAGFFGEDRVIIMGLDITAEVSSSAMIELHKMTIKINATLNGKAELKDFEALEKYDPPTTVIGGVKHWRYKNCRYHRLGAPAVIYPDGRYEYRMNGKLHCDFGPAFVSAKGNIEYWLDGKSYSKENWEKEVAVKNSKAQVIQEKLEDYDSTEEFCGTKYYRLSEKLHKISGPAIEYVNGKFGFFLHGESFSETDWRNAVGLPELAGPVVDELGSEIWRNEKSSYHRLDGPSIIHNNGEKIWYAFGKIHRCNGPAIEYETGAKEYFLYGKHYSEEEYCKLTGWKHPVKEIKVDEEKVVPVKDDPFKEYWLNGYKCINEMAFNTKLANIKFNEQLAKEKAEKHARETDVIVNAVARLKAVEHIYKELELKFETSLTNGSIAGEYYDNLKNSFFFNEKNELHSTCGPTVTIFTEDRKSFQHRYYVNGKFHNEHGPAIEQYTATGVPEFSKYYLNGMEFSKNAFEMHGPLAKMDAIVVEELSHNKKIDKECQSEVLKIINDVNDRRLQGKVSNEEALEEADKRFGRVLKHAAEQKIIAEVPVKINPIPSKTFSDKIKEDALDASYRVARRQIMKVIHNGLLKALEKNKTSKSQIRTLGEFFTTELGEGMMLGMMGAGAEFIPGLKDNRFAVQLAKEARTESMAIVGNLMIDSVITNVLPEITSVLNGLKETENKLRVQSLPVQEAQEEIEEEEFKDQVMSLKM